MRTLGILSFGLVLALVILPAFTIPSSNAHAQSSTPGSAPVSIVSPLPLPVSGTVAVSGFPASFTINNPASNPVLVRNVIEPVEIVLKHDLDMADLVGCAEKTLMTVPTGKRFVIEHVSLEVNLPIGQKPVEASFRKETASGVVAMDFLAPQPLGELEPGFGRGSFVGDHETHVYLAAGETLRFGWCRDQRSDTAGAELGLGGYLTP